MLRDLIEEYVKGLGFYEDESYAGSTPLWTHEFWQKWWTDPKNPDRPPRPRRVPFDQLIGSVLYDEETDGHAPS